MKEMWQNVSNYRLRVEGQLVFPVQFYQLLCIFRNCHNKMLEEKRETLEEET